MKAFGAIAFLMLLTIRSFGQVDAIQDSLPLYALELIEIRVELKDLGESAGTSSYELDSTSLATAKLGNAADLMRQLPGVSLKQYAPSGLATVSMRGTGAGHSQIYWENMPLNGAILGQFDFANAGGGLFSKMESMPGAASLNFGSGGIGGAINLSNPIPEWGNEKSVNLAAQLASFGNVATQARAVIRGKGLNWIGQGYFNSGKNDFPFTHLSLPSKPEARMQGAAVQSFGTMQSFAYRIGGGQLRANLWAFRNERHIPAPLLVTSGADFQEDQAFRTSIAYERRCLAFFGSYIGQLGGFWEDLYYQPSQATASNNRSSTYLAQFQTYQWQKYYGRRWYSPGAGLRIMRQSAEAGSSLEGISRITGSGHFGIGRQSTHGTIMEALLREEFLDGKFFAPQARLGICQPWKSSSHTRFFANVNRLIRIPSLSDLYWLPGGNPNLRPETSLGMELGISVPIFRDYKRHEVTATLFRNHVKDWILWTPNSSGIWSAENVRSVISQGFEFQHYIGFSTGKVNWQLLLNYAFVDSRDDQGFQLIYTPRHNAFARLGWRWKGFSAQLQHNQNSRRYITADNSEWLPGFGTTDVNLGFLTRFRMQQLDFQLGIRNLADIEYQMVAQRPLPGRSGFFRIDWKFKQR